MVDAAQLMDQRIPLVRLDDPAHHCIRLIGPSRHLIVVDHGGRLVGTITERRLQGVPGLTRAVELAVHAPIAHPSDKAHTPLHALRHSRATCVAVVDPDDHPLGLITLQDAVQLARFVLPSRCRVHALMHQRPGLPPIPHPAPVQVDDEARQVADALALWGGPVPVVSVEGHPLGVVGERDVVGALADVLAPGNAVFIDAIP